MHILIYHLLKHLFRGLVIVARHLFHHAPAAHTAVRHAAAAHTAVRHAAAAHTVAANALGGTSTVGGVSAATVLPAAGAGAIPLSSTANMLNAGNVRDSIMASVDQAQAAAVPYVGDFTLFSS